MIKRKFIFPVLSLCLVWLFFGAASAQEFSFNYYYSFESFDANEPPEIGGIDVVYPEAARKNGVEGTLKARMTLGENGKVRDIKIIQSLPHGVDDAVVKALQNLYFQPAKKNGQPVAITFLFDFVATTVYDESDKAVNKPKITEKPAPVYASNYASEKLKGKVQVSVLFYADGKLKVLGVSSVMPKEFDKAALEAAEKIHFLPATHKKSKAGVSQKLTVEYDFKP